METSCIHCFSKMGLMFRSFAICLKSVGVGIQFCLPLPMVFCRKNEVLKVRVEHCHKMKMDTDYYRPHLLLLPLTFFLSTLRNARKADFVFCIVLLEVITGLRSFELMLSFSSMPAALLTAYALRRLKNKNLLTVLSCDTITSSFPRAARPLTGVRWYMMSLAYI